MKADGSPESQTVAREDTESAWSLSHSCAKFIAHSESGKGGVLLASE